jgi:phosphate uptake regulator
MEIRKVQKLGYSTIVVSLPRSWVKEKSIKKGDSVIVRVEEDGSLRIIPYNMGSEKTVYERYIVDVTNLSSKGLVERILIGNYLLGHDTITFKTSDKRMPAWVLEEVMDAINRLAGVEIVDQRLNEITVQCFIDPTKFKLKGLVRRMYTLIFSMIEGIRIFLTEGDDSIFSQISGFETEADRLYWLVVRQLLLSQRSWRVAKEIGVTHPYHIVGNRAIVKALEDIADRIDDVGTELRRIPADWIDRSRDEPDGAVRRLDGLLSEIDNMVGDSMQAFIELSIEKANDVINEAEKFKEKTQEIDIWFISNVKDPLILSTLRLMLSHLMRVIDNVQLIAEITINRSLEAPSKFYYWEAMKKEEAK